MNEKLLPCKKCGGKANTIYYSNDEDMIIDGHAVFCTSKGCDAETECYDTEEEAITAWNDMNR
jgi:hypothetical protein